MIDESVSPKIADRRPRAHGDDIAVLALPTRIKRALELRGVKTVGDAKAIPMRELALMPNLGKVSLSALVIELERHLGPDPASKSSVKQAGTASAYRVQLTPRPIVSDADGLPVPNSHVVEIVFPGDAVETSLGPVNTIVGPGVAKILVGDATIRGVLLR